MLAYIFHWHLAHWNASNKQPLFPGDSELQQLLHIFKLLGTPSEQTWPGVSNLRDWHEFPQWKQQDLHKVIPQLDKDGIDLLQKMLVYDPSITPTLTRSTRAATPRSKRSSRRKTGR